ncbi:MAG TPA: ABC transporter permease [Gemmatimonadaceae bacterium]|nr:ABC transporter permease [Gemmatimonadaceae bacterium]
MNASAVQASASLDSSRASHGVFGELWSYRELLRRLVIRNLKVRYQRSVLGFAWALLNPLLTIAILVGVFGVIIRLPVEQYWAFLLSGYFAWVFVMHTLGTSTFAISEQASIVKSVALPTEILVLSAVTSRLIELVAELMLVVLVLVVVRHGGIPISLVLLPVLVTILLLMTVGLALPAACLAVFFRDVQHAMPVALTMLAYISPVFYPVDLVPDRLRMLYMLNPIAGVLTLFHRVLYEGRFPSASHLFVVSLAAILIFVIGYAFFRRYRALLAEIV